MKPLSKLAQCLLVTSFVLTVTWSVAQPANRDALIMSVNRVTVMSFNTDKPVEQARLVVDGKSVAADSWHADSTGFKLAVITPPSRDRESPQTEPKVQVHVEVSNMGGYMTGPYRPIREDNLFRRQYFGPGTNVVLNGWTQVYGETHRLGTNAVYELKIEIR